MEGKHRKQKEVDIYVLQPCGPGPKEVYDYIVVGAGPAGCVLAKNLAQSDRGNSSTLLLESGENNNDKPYVLNPLFPTVSVPGINMLNYADQPETATTLVSTNNTMTEPVLTINTGRVFFHVGRGLGGGSAKNFLNVVRGSPMYQEDLANNYTDSGWENWVDIYNSIETFNVENPPLTRGNAGAIQVTPVTTADPTPGSIDDELTSALGTLFNAPLVEDYNNLENSCSFFGAQRFVRPGVPVRSFGGNEYLGSDIMNQTTGKGIDKWTKLTVKTNSTVSRVLFNTRDYSTPRAKAVEVIGTDGQKRVYYARKEIILSAGAMYNPAILQRSGIGPAPLLERLNIGLVYDNPNVGQNLLSHYGNITVIETSLEWSLPSGPATGGFIDITPTGPGVTGRRHVQMQNTAGINSLLSSAIPFMDRNATDYPTVFSSLMWLMRQTSRGTVEIVSKDPITYPKYNANTYILRPNPEVFADSVPSDDVDSVIQFWVAWRQIVEHINASQGSEVMRIIWPPQNELFAANKPNLLQYIAAGMTITDHPTGTCQMGKADSPLRVVDDRLRVLGVSGLRCADLSVLPIIPDGNTCMPSYLVGVKCAQFITGQTYNRDQVA